MKWILIEVNYDSYETYCFTYPNLDGVYQYLLTNIFSVGGEKSHSFCLNRSLEFANIPYYMWSNEVEPTYSIFNEKGTMVFSFNLSERSCWQDFMNFYERTDESKNHILKYQNFLTESAKKNYNWIVVNILQISRDRNEYSIFYGENLDEIYYYLTKNIFTDNGGRDDASVGEIEFTNVPYYDWHGGDESFMLFKIGESSPSFIIDLNSADCWQDFMDFYQNTPLLEAKKFPNLKKLDIDGFEVLMGRDAESNDYLTMMLRKKGDLWFHAQGVPGSHLILRPGSRIPDQGVKQKVAELAAKNSKAVGLTIVICCPINLVQKEVGSNPGQVKVEKSLNVEYLKVNI